MTAFLDGLRNESREVAVSQLLHYLPLLRPANSDGVGNYVHLLPSLLASFLEDDPQQQSIEIQQLLTYALIHPAISLESKRSLAEVIRHLDEDGAQEMALSLLENSSTHSAVDTFRPVPDAAPAQYPPPIADTFQTTDAVHSSSRWDPWKSYSSVLASPSGSSSSRIRRSNSLTPPSAYPPSDVWTKPNDSGGRAMKPRSQSLSSPSEKKKAPTGHCPLSPQNSLTSSASGGSDSVYSDDPHLRLPSFHIPGSGMRDVPTWLKGLRLHKYSHLFSLMSYEEMLSLTEEQLEVQGVTKGARHKIALSIVRLRERPVLLAQLEKEVVDSGNVANALNELKTMLATPIKAYQGPPPGGHQQLYAVNSLTPSPLLVRDDTSGYSSLEGSVDNLAPRSSDCVDVKDDVEDGKVVNCSEMPTVIVSAASDSAEEGSDSCGDDCVSDAAAYRFSPVPIPDDDLPGHITRLLGKICTQLLVSVAANEENIGQFVSLLERCVSHEAFTHRQRCLFGSWKEQANRIWNTLPSGSSSSSCSSSSTAATPTSRPKNVDSPRYARRWSNIAHYPGFYCDSANASAYGMREGAAFLFPPQRQQRPLNANNRPFVGPNSHNSYGQHYHHLTAGGNGSMAGDCSPAMRSRNLAPTTSLPLSNSLQVGSHLPLQHRNSFCVSTLSQPSSMYSPHGYSTVPSAIDPYHLYSDRQHSKLDHLPSQAYDCRLGMQCGRSASTANGAPTNAMNGINGGFFNHDKDPCDIDLNHRLESLCLSMTEHALEGADHN